MKQRIPKYRYHWTEDGPECAFPYPVISFFGMGDDMEIQVKTGDEPHDTAEYGLDGGVLCQFTGLLDKNGEEIYEGDVVECRIYDDQPIRGCVVWIDHGSYIATEQNADTGEWTGGMWAAQCFMEVIGNIYENPELIKP